MTMIRPLSAALIGAVLVCLGGCSAVEEHLGDPCTVQVAGDVRDLDRATAMAATTIAAVGSRNGVSEASVAAVLEQVLAGDATVTDPETAATAYASVPTDVRPSNDSLLLARVLLGADGPTLTCRASVKPTGTQEEAANGLTPRAGSMLGRLEATFGDLPTGGYAPGGVNSGHVDGSAHYDGRAVDVFFRPVAAENRHRGWVLAQWAVAHAEQLELATVIFDDHIWSSARSRWGWRDYHPSGDPDNEVLRHLDHVHLDVVRGSSEVD
jgi:hypothetical protein